jgi:hypothetical protein
MKTPVLINTGFFAVNVKYRQIHINIHKPIQIIRFMYIYT